MGVKLRRGVAINGPSRIVLECGGDELARSFRGVNIADPGLRVSL
jgi:hypothetical protein